MGKENYEGRRITISFFAVKKLCEIMNIPNDCKPHLLSAAIEKMIFEYKPSEDNQNEKQ